MPTPDDVARICHEANRIYCLTLGDDSHLPWEEAPGWQQDSAINGVRFHVEHYDASPAGSHENWMSEKIEQGWTHGHIKDPDRKTHPCLVPWHNLPPEQQAKDRLFMAIVRALIPRGDF